MCAHCIEAGFSATVYNRTRGKTEPLLAMGARLADSPRAAAEEADVVLTIVGFPAEVREVVFGDAGVLAGLRPGGVLVDMTTSEPSLAVEIHQAAHARGIASLDAPVSGGDIGAREARLAIMIGGDAAVAKALEPLFQAMGKTIAYMGPPGSGQHAKMVNQILIATTMIGVVEGLLYAHRAGLDLSAVIAVVGAGAAGSWSLNNLGPRIVKRNFEPGFLIDHFVKDMGIAVSEARRLRLNLPGLALAQQLYRELQAQGHGRKGTHALMLALEKLNAAAGPQSSEPA
jgi:3-hydroxyisobutyrate dehydrogenase